MHSYQPDALRASYHTMEHGEPRLRLIRSACTAAEQAKDFESALLFHHDLIQESVFSGDRYQALIDFPQYMAIYEAHPELEEAYAWQTLWIFKWIVEASVEFYQIPKSQVLQWFLAFRKELAKHGYSLKPFYEKRAIFFSYYDRAKLRLDYGDFLAAPRDELSDGEPEEWNTQVRWELLFGHYEKAMRAAEHLFRNRMFTNEVPASTYGYLLTDACIRQDTDAADHYAALLRPYCDGERYRMEQLGLLFCYDAQHHPEEGLAFLRKQEALRKGSHNPFLCYWFDHGASVLLRAAAKSGADEAPDALLAKAAAYDANARALAAQFDARNGSDFFTARCEQQY